MKLKAVLFAALLGLVRGDTYWDPRCDSVPECWETNKKSPACHCNLYCAASDRHYTCATGQCGGCTYTQCDDIGKFIRVVDVTGGQDCVLDHSRPRPGCKCWNGGLSRLRV